VDGRHRLVSPNRRKAVQFPHSTLLGVNTASGSSALTSPA
jgi:hypothetical protein